MNAFPHAAASMVEVDLQYDKSALTLCIRDDGRGLEVENLKGTRMPGHFGLICIQERAERIGGAPQIWSRDGAGTEASCRVDARRAYQHRRPG